MLKMNGFITLVYGNEQNDRIFVIVRCVFMHLEIQFKIVGRNELILNSN